MIAVPIRTGMRRPFLVYYLSSNLSGNALMRNLACPSTFLFIFSISVSVFAAQEPPADFLLDLQRVAKEAKDATAARFPDADRVLVNDRVLETYEKDGTSIHWDDEYTRILTEKGRRDASEFEFFFDAHYGTAMVVRAEILKPDGRVVPIDTAAYSRIMTEQGQMGMNIYDPNYKTLSLSLPGIEIGDTYHILTCEVTHKAIFPGTWSGYSVFEADMPILRLDYAVSSPPELPLRHTLLRAAVSNTVSYAATRQPDGRTLHTWKIRDVPRIFPEPDMPPLHTQVQRLLVSTLPDWRTVSRWYWTLCQPALAKVTPQMRQKIDALVAGAATRDEKIRRIFKFVSQEIRYMGITAEEVSPGYEPHDVNLTFDNRYGVCRDKAALLAALLPLAGIPAYPVLINASNKMDPDAPLPYFNHAITAVDKPGGGYELMDPTDENTRDLFPAYLCNRSYLVAKETGEALLVSDVYPAEKNLARIATEGTLDETDTLLLKTKIRFDGINDNAYRSHFLNLKAEQRRKFFETVLKNRFAGAEVLACTITPDDLQDTDTPLDVALTARIPDFPIRGETLDLAALPWLGTSLGYANFVIGQTGLEKRRFPMETGITCGVEEHILIDASDSLGAPYALPDDIHICRSGVVFDMAQHAERGRLEGRLNYRLNTPEFSPSEYLDLKSTLQEIEAAGRRRPLFDARRAQTPDYEILVDETDTRLDSPHAWTTTQRCSKRILTYAGKKQNAELKYTFNPVWQHLEIVSAVVSNADGSVRAITPKEINLMDAQWVGSAPRYPAAKMLVANLPGVETGSVISVVTRFTQTNACFYSHRQAFGGTAPSASETYRLTFPVELRPNLQTFHFDAVTFAAETNAGVATWTWQTQKPPLVRTEERLPPWHLFQPTLFVSFGDWRSYARSLRTACENASEGDRNARKHARKLVAGIKDPSAKLRAVRDDVLRTIRPAGPSFLDLPPDTLSSPDRTLADQYGHAADRALLLATMLDAVGFDADILLASGDTSAYPPGSQPQRDVPQTGFFRNPLVKVESRGVTYYLNDGDQYDEPGTSSADRAPALGLDGKLQTVAVAEPFKSTARNAWTVDLAADGTATITVTNWYFGPSAGSFRKQYDEMLPEDRRRHYLELAGFVSKAARAVSPLVTDTTSYPGMRTYALAASRYASVAGDTLTLLIPEVAGAIFPLRADTRVNPLFFNANDTSELTCRIILPQGFTKLPLLPESKRWSLPNGLGSLDYRVSVSTRTDGRKEVCIVRCIDRTSGEAAPELYPALLEYNRRFTHPSVRTLVAERTHRSASTEHK